MSEIKFVGKDIKIKYSGVFDWGDFYRKLKYWLDYNGYGDQLKNFNEEKYVERIKPDGKQLEIVWSCSKNINDNLVNNLKVTFFIVGLNKVEVERDGKKINLNKGDIEMKFTGYLEIKDFDSKNPDSFMDKMYRNLIIKDRIDQHMIDLYDKLYKFIDEAKGYLNLQKF